MGGHGHGLSNGGHFRHGDHSMPMGMGSTTSMGMGRGMGIGMG